jgi:diguanylate cyclase (GGDEF)-like protein
MTSSDAARVSAHHTSTSVSRSRGLLALVLLLSLATVATITGLQLRSASSRATESKLVDVKAQVIHLQADPYSAMAVFAGTPQGARAQTKSDERSIVAALAQLERSGATPSALREVAGPLRANFAALDRIVPIAGSPTFTTNLDPAFLPLLATATATSHVADVVLSQAGLAYQRRSTRQQTQATIGSASAILLLFLAFALVYRSSFRARAAAERLAAENALLAADNRHEARTDALTGLRNRRALIDDLEAHEPGVTGEQVLVLFDLDGFKHYNDTFGHPAGDELLARLGERLQAAVAGTGSAYRMGGDEFCVLAPLDHEAAGSIVQLAADALSEAGDAFEIGCSHGTALIPLEAYSADAALLLADQRMYEHKAGRSSASRQSSDVLLKVLSERNAGLRDHLTGVAALAMHTAEQLALDSSEVKRIGLAAELHDVGKTAIPDAILNKPGPLDDGEWGFMRRHTLIGERIILAAPSLAPTAELVRSSHEAFDGSGYPDALRGDAIPLGARIIAVCDAFDAMVSDRAYRAAMPVHEAIAELHRCAGTQFDPDVVAAFCGRIADGELVAHHAPVRPVSLLAV